MNIKKKWIIIGFLVLLLCWTGNIYYYMQHLIKEPIFLKHYLDVEPYMNNFKLFYLKDNESEDIVESISFPEIGQEYLPFEENIWKQGDKFYSIQSLTFTLYNMDSDDFPDELKEKTITKVKVKFSSGITKVIDIGRINFSVKPKNSKLNHYSGGPSDDGFYNSYFKVKKDIKINKIYSHFPELIDDVLYVKVKDTDIKHISYPINFKKNDGFSIAHEFRFDKDDLRKIYIYDMGIYIESEDKNGNKGYEKWRIYDYTMYINSRDLRNLIDREESE